MKDDCGPSSLDRGPKSSTSVAVPAVPAPGLEYQIGALKVQLLKVKRLEIL